VINKAIWQGRKIFYLIASGAGTVMNSARQESAAQASLSVKSLVDGELPVTSISLLVPVMKGKHMLGYLQGTNPQHLPYRVTWSWLG
jgi:hypothetical protein